MPKTKKGKQEKEQGPQELTVNDKHRNLLAYLFAEGILIRYNEAVSKIPGVKMPLSDDNELRHIQVTLHEAAERIANKPEEAVDLWRQLGQFQTSAGQLQEAYKTLLPAVVVYSMPEPGPPPKIDVNYIKTRLSELAQQGVYGWISAEDVAGGRDAPPGLKSRVASVLGKSYKGLGLPRQRENPETGEKEYLMRRPRAR